MNNLAVAVEHQVPNPILGYIPPELLAMAKELHRLREGGSAGKTFAEIEAPMVEICRQMGKWALETTLTSHPQAAPGQEHACPRCGRRFRILRQSQHREFRSRLGRISYTRPYGTCDRCEISGAPMDWELGLPSVDVSVGVLERVCHSTMVGRSFSDAAEIMQVHDEVDLSAKQIRVLAEGEGRRLAQERDREASVYEQGRLELKAEQPCAPPGLIVICADGGRVQTRNGFAERGAADQEELVPAEEEAGDCVRQADRKERWKENKVGVVYDAVAKPQPRAAHGEYEGAKAKVKTYVATMQPWKSFGWMLRVEAERRGYAKAKTKLFLADGAGHIRELQKLHFPETIFGLDWAHAAEHVSNCAKALFGEGTTPAREWYEEHNAA